MGVKKTLNTVFIKPSIFYKFNLHLQNHLSLVLVMQDQNDPIPSSLGT